jgi:UDP-N-acetyl-D-mannosaminuronate dehydrogenase/intein/homing endonuclease
MVVSAARAISQHLRPGQLVVLESTTYPGTTEELILPILEEGGLKVGQSFFLAFSPERVDPGNPRYNTRNTPKIIGGVTPDCTQVAQMLYARAIDTVIPVSSTRTAEMVKLLENTFRSVNIGLVNEVALMCERLKVDVWEVIEAAASKPFGFMPFFPGPGLGGHCLAGGETVCVRDQSGVRVLPLERLFATAEAGVRTTVRGIDVAVPAGLETLSVDCRTGDTRFAPITHLFRRAAATPVLRLRLRDNRTVSVTDKHPMLVRTGTGIEVRPASELKPGDGVVISRSWPRDESWKPCIDVLGAAAAAGIPTRVMPRVGGWADHKELVAPVARRNGAEPKDVWRHNTLPLAAFLELEAAGQAPFRRDEVVLSTGKGRSGDQVPGAISINEDFARLIGYYLSEGCIAEDGSLRIRFCFGAHEHELIGDTVSILTRLGVRTSIHKLKRWPTVQVKVYSRILGHVFRDVLMCGRNSDEMQIPARLMAGPAAIRMGLLSGLLRGDGDVHPARPVRARRKRGRERHHHFNAATVGYFSSSPVLFQQVTLLLQGMGLVPTFRRSQPHLRMSGSQMKELTPLLAAHNREKREAHRARRLRPMPARTARPHGPYVTVQLAVVEQAERQAVYSMEVAETGTFVTSYGIAVHNCIPIDPLYLSWKLKTLNYRARFIELAGEINAGMPEYVCQRVAGALNDREKSVKGSRILILGVAYKRDVDDVRESPALDILKLLESRGAHLSYNDPHVPELKVDQTTLRSVDLLPALRRADLVVIVTDHSSYSYRDIVEAAPVIVDTRNATKGIVSGKILKI